MNPSAATTAARPRFLEPVRKILGDALYRGSFYLLVNTVATSAIGFIFWTLAAHRYSASTVGVFSGVTSGASLLAGIAALGLPLTMTRHIASAENPRQLVAVAVAVIATVGTALCLAAIFLLGPHLPAVLHVRQHGTAALLVAALVVFIALGSTLDAGLVAIRSSRIVLIKNLAGSIAKLVAMLLLATFRSSGLLISFGFGLILSSTLSGLALGWKINGKRTSATSTRTPWRYLSITSGNYLATVIGILPMTVVPLEVLAVRGASETARFSVAFLVAGFLNFIPSTMGQVLFAEISRGDAPLGKQLRKALRAVYGLLLPSLLIMLAAAPFILRLFGQAYAAEATDCLRVLALSALPAGGTYLVDSILIARDRTTAYTFMQIANAALVLGLVRVLLPRGLTAAAGGWAIAQGLTLVIGLIVIAAGRTGRHHPKVTARPADTALKHPHEYPPPRPLRYAFEPQVRDLLAAWPTMPTMLIAEQIGWEKPIHLLSERVSELRPGYSQQYQHSGQKSFLPGEVAQCSVWFPPVKIPVGRGQTRSSRHLPVLTMVTGYSRWASAILIPTGYPEDLFAGWWKLLVELGAVPRTLTSHADRAIGWWQDGQAHVTDEARRFSRSLGTALVLGGAGGARTLDLIAQMNGHLELAFLHGRIFTSPEDFNRQLGDWLAGENGRFRRPPSYAPDMLIAADTAEMLPLPPIPPATGWRLTQRVGDPPFINFDTNRYSVPPALIGHTVEIAADLRQVRVMYNQDVLARHDRAWTRNSIIGTPTRETAAP